MEGLLPSLHALSLTLPTGGSGEKRPSVGGTEEGTDEQTRRRKARVLRSDTEKIADEMASSLVTVDDADIEIDNTLPLAKRLVSNYNDIAPVEDDSDKLKTLRDTMRVEVERYKKSKANFEELFNAVVYFTIFEIEESVENAINNFVDAAAEVAEQPLPDRLVSRDVVDEMRQEPFFSYKLLIRIKDNDVLIIAHCPKSSKTWEINKDTVSETKEQILSFFVLEGECVINVGKFEREAFKKML